MSVKLKTSSKCFAATMLVGAAACSGGGGGSPAVATSPPIAVVPPTPLVALRITSVDYAQTHILPEAGLVWTLPNDSASLKLVGKRDTLVLVSLAVSDAISPVINGTANGVSLGKITLNPPSSLPTTEAGGAPYKPGVYSGTLPAAWLVTGLSLTVSADNYLVSTASKPTIGAPSVIDLNIVPFYLFGATDANTQSLSNVQAPTPKVQNDIYDTWPVSELKIKPFAGGRIEFANLVVAPRANSAGVRQPAYLVSNMDQQRDSFAAMDTTLNLMKQMRAANGEAATNNLYYGAMLVLNAAGRQTGLGGGLGGGGGGVGDTSYAGIFIHEMGHAFGLPHAIDGFNAGKYPYAGGSTKGSVWGYNQIAKVFLNLLVDRSAVTFARCAASNQTNAAGQCYKQDLMQSGAEDRTAGYTFGTFSDFNIGKIQQWFEGKTTTDVAGKRTISGGVVFPDSRYASGYARWDTIDGTFFEYTPTLNQGGLYGINDDLPIAKNVPVYTIMVAFSQARSAGASMIYPPVRYSGNLIKTFDPTNPQDLSDFKVDTGKYNWYCKGYGCDYSIRITYADGSVMHRVLKDGFRPWFTPTAALSASASDPISASSFKTWAVNVPGDSVISKIEMLDTPSVWLGLPANPTVLLTRVN